MFTVIMTILVFAGIVIMFIPAFCYDIPYDTADFLILTGGVIAILSAYVLAITILMTK